jgi:hypothetical protein
MMQKFSCPGIVALLLALPFVTCQKSQTSNTKPTLIYVAGSESYGIPVYWVNGAVNLLPANQTGSTTDLSISGTDTCFSGTLAGAIPIYWINNVQVTLPLGTGSQGFTSGIAAVGGDVYTSGTQQDPSGINIAMYWHNQTAIPLTDTTTTANTSGIAVAGADVYVAGNTANLQDHIYHATLWKNGVKNILPDSINGSNAFRVTIVNSDIYVAGKVIAGSTLNNIPAYWKNDTLKLLELGPGEQGIAVSVAVSGADVLVAGFVTRNGISVATYWKNGVPFYLTDGTQNGSASDIAILGSDVYISGREYNSTYSVYLAKYWLNGNGVIVGSTSFDSFASAIHVISQ